MSNGATPGKLANLEIPSLTYLGCLEERLLAAARNDDEEGLLQAIEEDANINCWDG
jgi:hypothetical protein